MESDQCSISNDPATWIHLETKSRDLIVLKSPPCKPECLPRDISGRPYPLSVFPKKLQNGEYADRDWMVWSKERSALFCFPCCLFEVEDIHKQQSKFVQCGVDNHWKKMYEKVKKHELNTNHIKNYIKWKKLISTLKGKTSGIDETLLKSIKKEEGKWRRILIAVIDVILFLAEGNLPFRGSHTTVDKDDCGIFLSTLKLIGKYNKDIKDHLESVSKAKVLGQKVQVNYFSWKTQNEFLKICGEKVKKTLFKKLRSLFITVL